MKLISRYIFLFLAVFFVSPLAGKDAQRILKFQLKSFETKTAASEQNDNAGKAFFCELEDSPENNFEEDDTTSKFLAAPTASFSFLTESVILSVSQTPVFRSAGKLFLLFHALKLDC